MKNNTLRLCRLGFTTQLGDLYARLDCKTTVEVLLGFAVQVFSCTNQNHSNPTTGEQTRVEEEE